MNDTVVAAHLRQLELRGQTPDTVYCRRRALARLAAALPVPLLEAAAADLQAWRASLSATVTYQDSRDLLLVQGLLGHAQPSTTAGYARWDQAAAADVVAHIPAPRHLKVVSE